MSDGSKDSGGGDGGGGDGGGGQQNLTFVVTTNPYDKKSAANKKRVRSVAALKSWPARRKKTFEGVDQSGRRGGFVVEPNEPVAGPSRPKSSRSTSSASSQRYLGPAEISKDLNVEPLFEKCTRSSGEDCNCIHCRSERRWRNLEPSEVQSTDVITIPRESKIQSKKRTADGELKAQVPEEESSLITPPYTPTLSPLNTVNSSGKAEPFNCYPVPYLPWFDRILHHMMTVFAPRGWPALKINNEQGEMWEWFMTQHALAEPALFYVRLLFASGDLIRMKALDPSYSIWLQTQAVNAINEALQDSDRATSDPIILAVGRIALHEAFYGDREAANAVHRPAQKRMIEMRGGMKNLAFPGLVKRLMRLVDNIMAMQSGTERMLEDDDENQNFSISQQVNVMENWVPRQGQDLRRKIRISDLLSPEPS